MLSRGFIRNNINLVAISIYVMVFGILVYIKPNFLYNPDGSLREFGLGSNKKTVIPVWLASILIAIMSYFFVLYYLASPKLNF
jgi:heme/copper-type cytochrome/quinol oxidase subunit 2